MSQQTKSRLMRYLAKSTIRSVLLKNSIFRADHNSHGRGGASKKNRQGIGQRAGFVAYSLRRRFAVTTTGDHCDLLANSTILLQLDFRVFQQYRPKADLGPDLASTSGRVRPRSEFKNYATGHLACWGDRYNSCLTGQNQFRRLHDACNETIGPRAFPIDRTHNGSCDDPC